MFRYAVLGSGSSANSYIFELGNFSFILDNGFSPKELRRRMREMSFNPENLEFIFLTHIHSDHLKGVEVLSRDLQIPVVIHEKLDLDQHTKGEVFRKLSITPGREYIYRDLKFRAFETYHDAPHSLSYHFDLAGVVITVITDTGKSDSIMFDYARKSHILFLESNYCETMLAEGKYPYFLKERIRSDRGHLSNKQAAEFLDALKDAEHCTLKQIYLCHLSKNNNSVEAVQREIGSDSSGPIPLRICDRDEMVRGIDIQASKSSLVPEGSSSSSEYSETSTV